MRMYDHQLSYVLFYNVTRKMLQNMNRGEIRMDAGKTMYDYHGWAMKALLDHVASLPANTLIKEVKSSYSSIAKTISHTHAVDTMWLKILEGTLLQ